MTIAVALSTVEEIKRLSSGGDWEAAHSKEDDFHQEVLAYIAEHCSDLECKRLAIAALKTCDLEFSRWCA
jgi:hypothetical protein